MIDPTHLPVLLIAVPIVGGALVGLGGLTDRATGWPIAAATATVQTVLAAWLLATVATDGTVRYAVGGFPARVGIELVVDGLSALVAMLVAVVALGVLAYARTAGPHGDPFFGLYCLLLAGLSGMSVTGDVFNLYVFLEITGLAAYALVASGSRDGAAVAALKYLIVGTVGASLYLLGVGYLLVATGTLNMGVLASTLGGTGAGAVPYTDPLVTTAFALTMGGLVVKVALFPVHTWQPDAYATAPASVSALISALVSTVAAYAVARLLFSVFTVGFFDAVPLARTGLLAVAAVSVVAGALLAVSQRDVQRMLAYSSVSQFGLVVAGFALASSTAVVGATLHLLGHAVTKGGLFAAAGIVERRSDARTIDEYAGLASRSPVVAAAIAVLAVAMVGVPPTVGFVGKLYLLLGAADVGAWAVVAVLLASTLLTLAYFARLGEAMYFRGPDAADHGTADGAADAAVTDGGSSAPVSVGMVAVVVLAALVAAGLGLAAPVVESLLEPTLSVVQ